MSETIGFIGLGLLGLPIATNLLDAGYSMRVYNRTASKADALVARGADRAARPADAATPGGIVVSIVWDDAALEGIVTSEGFLERLGPGGIHVSMSTVLPETARRLAELHARRGSVYVEAPVFGRPEAAAARKLWIPVAGAPAAKERVKPVLEALGGQRIFDFGEAVGAATAVKLAGNFLIFSAAHSLGEALSMLETSGVDTRAALEMLTTTLFPAPIYQSYGKRIVDKTPAIESDIPLKDVGLFKHTAEQGGSATPIANHLYDVLKSAQRPR
jgi:3-hydroxyisobutyrate dehydrogenase-like beta-hydroxyacid dehydrogenase